MDHESELRKIVESAAARTHPLPLALWANNFATGDSYLSNQWLESLGYIRSDLAGRPVREFWKSVLHPDEISRISLLRRQKASGTSRSTLRVRRADGTYKWIDSYASAVRMSDDGWQEVLLGVDIDVSDKRAELEALQVSEARYRALLGSIEQGTIVLDLSGRVVSMNGEAARLCQTPPGEAAGRPLSDVVVLHEPVSGKPVVDVVSQLLLSGRRSMPLALLLPVATDGIDGSEPAAEVAVSHSLLLSDDDIPLGAMLTLRDLAPDLANQQRISRDEHLRALGQLAGGVAHDFNNVLSIVTNAAELLRDGDLEERTRSALIERILASSERATSLTSRLLAFGNQAPTASGRVDVHAVLESISTVLAAASGDGIDLVMRLEAEEHELLGDAFGLESALLNLALNGLQAMPDGGMLSIETRNLHSSGASSFQGTNAVPEIMITISDTGIGIRPADRSRVFEPFFTTKGEDGGYGLGLAMVHSMVIQHRGEISVESAVGRGTTFSLRLPCHREGEDVSASNLLNSSEVATGASRR